MGSSWLQHLPWVLLRPPLRRQQLFLSRVREASGATGTIAERRSTRETSTRPITAHDADEVLRGGGCWRGIPPHLQQVCLVYVRRAGNGPSLVPASVHT
jgi:hypothetical protein